jgi:HlyD family secretion protein
LLIKIKPDAYVAQKDRQVAALNSSKSQLEIQRANLVKMEQDFKRQDEMFKKNLISEADFEVAKAGYNSQKAQFEASKHNVAVAEAALNETLTNLDKTTIQSPMEGIVSALNSRLGERVFGNTFSSGTAIMIVADLSKMEADVDVGENDVVLISIGDTTRIQIDAYPGRKFIGLVYEIANSAKTKGLGTQEEVVNFVVKIKIVDKDVVLRPGMSCTADVETETRSNIFTVPIQSVTTRTVKKMEGPMPEGGSDQNVTQASQQKQKKDFEKPESVIFVIENNVSKLIKVKTGISDDKFIEIVSGLNGNEDVVSGSYRAINRELEDGKAVKVDNIKKKEGQN